MTVTEGFMIGHLLSLNAISNCFFTFYAVGHVKRHLTKNKLMCSFFCCIDLEALCSTCGIPSPLFSCCFWLGYCNSCLNPFIYASTSREFKRAFSKILCGRRGTSNGANRNYMQHHHLMPLSHQARTPSVSNVSPTLARRESPTQARLSDEDQST